MSHHDIQSQIFESLKSCYPESEVKALSRIILEEVTGNSFNSICFNNQTPLSDEQIIEIDSILSRLQKHEPIQYILGKAEFFGLDFCVNRDTLIPRPETEELVELIINENKQIEPSILDIGTGSGCIAISLSKKIPKSYVSAWDFSEGALKVARKNSEINNTHVSFDNVDILKGYPKKNKYDIIVSNPPYITESEKSEMHANVLDYEPHSALFVADDKSLIFYERIADIGFNLLNKNGRIYFEINRSKGINVIDMLNQKGYSDIVLIKDISGNDRIVRCQKSK